MRPWEGVPPSLLPEVIGTPIFLVALLAVSLLLIFFGRRVIKVVTFVLGGFIGAYFGGTLGAFFLSSLGAILGEIAGFLLGGLLSLAFLSLAIGFGLGYSGYAITQLMLGATIPSLIVGVVLFVLGVILSGRILTLVSVFIGSFLLLNALAFTGLQLPLAIVVVSALAILGLWIQNESIRRGIQKQRPQQNA